MNKGTEKIEQIDLSKLSRSELEDEFIKLYERCTAAEARAEHFMEEFRIAMQKRFGRSSEKEISDQITIAEYMKKEFGTASGCPSEDENLQNGEKEVRELINQAGNMLKSGAGKSGIPKKNLANLEVITVEFVKSPEEQICPECGGKLEFVRNVIRKELTIDRPKVYVKKYVTALYVCKNCAETDKNPFHYKEGALKPLFYNSSVSSELVADSIHKKYALALPYDRLAKDYARMNIPITKNNLCKWSVDAALRFFKPIVGKMRDIQLKEAAIHCDETHTKVINGNNQKESYVWVTTTAEYQKEHPIVIYNYRPGRSDEDAREVLGTFKGYVMCDGYTCYNSVLNRSKKTGAPPLSIKPVACMVHVKREFVDALKGLPKKDWGKTGAYQAVRKLEKLFHIDNEIRFTTYEERKEIRLGDLKAAMIDFFDYCRSEKDKTLPSTKYGQAIKYALNQEQKAMRLFEDGRLELENNMAERAVKPYVISRKNSLFNDTERGAEASCILFSIVETAKHNQLDVYKYLKYVLDECRGMHKGESLSEEKIKKLLPWSKQIPDDIKEQGKG